MKAKDLRGDGEAEEVLSRVAAEGVILTEVPLVPGREPVSLQMALAVARRVPQLMEALPALVLTRPGVFSRPLGMPPDLAQVVSRLRAGSTADFRGQRAAGVRAWVKKLRRGRTRLMAFRLTEADQELLLGLTDELGLSATDVLRHALRVVAANPHGD